jgi:hypothetical protein
VVLLLWLLGILFPMAWLGKVWPGFGRIFDRVFAPGWVHVAMHAGLYAGLAMMFSTLPGRLTGWRRSLLILSLGMLVGVLQEVFQAWSGGANSLAEAAFDLGVDGAGCLGGLWLLQLGDRFKDWRR